MMEDRKWKSGNDTHEGVPDDVTLAPAEVGAVAEVAAEEPLRETEAEPEPDEPADPVGVAEGERVGVPLKVTP